MDFNDKVKEAEKRVPNMEYMLCSGLQQPYNNTNSAQRKIMHKIHRSHVLPIKNGEQAIVETGYEIRFGDLSSSITVADTDYKVISKISKFSFSPNHFYWLIILDEKTKTLDVVTRIPYHHVTESYGYLYNNEYLDSLREGSDIPKDTVVQKSIAFDEYNNRKDGANFNVLYLSLDQNMEDSVIFSDVAIEKMKSSLICPVKININENDIPLDLLGNDLMYKCIPDIGEKIKDGILLALRKEKNDELLFNQSIERLKKVMINDKKFVIPGNGTVIDINIYCNNIENLELHHNAQFKMYYNEVQRSSTEIVQRIMPFISQGYKLSYDLQKLYINAKRVINHDSYISKRTFSNIELEIIVLLDKPLEEGDKTSNRFGGKGVVSKILKQELMPKFGDEYVDVILNSYTMPNRENPGQNFEQETNFIGRQIVKRIETGEYSLDECMDMVYRFLHIVSPVEEKELREIMDLASDPAELKRFYLESIILEGGDIKVSTLPISESMDIDKLASLYDEFPWIDALEVTVPMIGSNGKVRRVPARRKMIVGKEYMFRLKQYAEEKFSANSLSAVNSKSENFKSKASRNFNEFFRNTPIRFGNMELNDETHLGIEVIVANLMIHSVSPHARRLTEQLYFCDPFDINIELDKDSINRSAEIVATYLKTIGRKLVFRKIKRKKIKPITFDTVTFKNSPVKSAIYFVTEDDYSAEERRKNMEALEEEKRNNPNIKQAIYFNGKSRNREEE